MLPNVPIQYDRIPLVVVVLFIEKKNRKNKKANKTHENPYSSWLTVLIKRKDEKKVITIIEEKQTKQKRGPKRTRKT